MKYDPYEILGVSNASTEEDLRLAWREKMRSSHPDVGGSHEETIHFNQALKDALALLATRPSSKSASRDGASRVSRYTRDVSSFTVDVLPVECWHALEIVAGQCGAVIVEEPPYLLEFTMHDSGLSDFIDAWCRCELVPEAGGTTVHVTVGSFAHSATNIELVRDHLVDSLNALDW